MDFSRFQWALAGVGAVVGYFVGGFDKMITAFLVILFIDTITGMIKAIYLGEYSSKKFRKGFLKKTAYMLAILLAVQLDKMLETNGALRWACLVLFSGNEASSIVENLGLMGIPIPKKLKKALEVLNENEKG